MMCRLSTIASVVFAAMLMPILACAEEPGYVGGFGALPLADGLVEIAGAGVVFDTPDGRIVERYASGTVAAAAVADFYDATLPALGWHLLAPLVFARDDEVLSVTVYPPDTDNRLTVRFSLAPR
ncbi:MAG: hypothetical protein VCC99_13175 [Alphaproteobacteria bacterium]